MIVNLCPLLSSKSLNGLALNDVLSLSTPGVLFDRKFKLNLHFESIVNKAFKIQGSIKRWSKEFSEPYVTKLLFKSRRKMINRKYIHFWHRNLFFVLETTRDPSIGFGQFMRILNTAINLACRNVNLTVENRQVRKPTLFYTENFFKKRF